MDKLTAMTTFIEVAKHQSFVEASEHLNLSPPAVTRAIAWLESHLQLKLFHRTTRHVRLTESGAHYLLSAKNILESIEEAEANAQGINATPRGTLTITAPVLFGEMHITPIINEYLDRYKQASVTAIFTDRVTSLIEEELDIAIRIGHLEDSNLYATAVGHVRQVVCASPHYLVKRGIPKQPQDLKNHDIIFANTFETKNSWHFINQSQSERVKLSSRFLCNHNGAARRAAIQGCGLTKLMSYQVRQEIEQGKLQCVLTDFEPKPLPIHLIKLDGQRTSAKIQAFLELAACRLKTNPSIQSTVDR